MGPVAFLSVLAVVAGGTILLGMAMSVPLAQRKSRALPPHVVGELRQIPTDRQDQHLVDLELADGRVVKDVRIAWNTWPAWVGGKTIRKRYRPRDVVHARLADAAEA